MVRPDVDGELIAPAKRAERRVRFGIATHTDDAAIRQLLRETPMRGAISVTFEREPGYFLGANIGGANDDTFVAYDGARLACMGRCSTRTAWVNGRIQRTGYLAELRLAADARGRFDILRDGYRFFHSMQEANGADVYFTSIADGNSRARRLLERGVPGLPRYTHAGDLTTLLISTRSRHKSCLETLSLREVPLRGTTKQSSWIASVRFAHLAMTINSQIWPNCIDKVERLDPKSLTVRATDRKRVQVNLHHLSAGSASAEELSAFLNDVGSQYQLAAAWRPETLRALASHDLPLESFAVVRKNDAIVAAGALWDQRRFRQTVVRAYAPLLRYTRPMINVVGGVFGYSPLPTPGDVLSHAFLSPLAIRVGHDYLIEDLVSMFCRIALERGIHYLTLALPSRDPRLKVLQRRFRTRAYCSRIYRVDWPGMPNVELDQRHVLPEVALL